MSIDEVISAAYRYGSSRRFESEERSDKRMSTLRTAIEQRVAEEVEREREECAAVCQSIEDGENDACGLARECVAAIRARGTT